MITLQDIVTKHTSLDMIHARQKSDRERRKEILFNSKLVKDGDKFTTADVVRILSNYRDGVVVSTDVARQFLKGMVDEGHLVMEQASTGAARIKYMKAPEHSLERLWRPSKNDIPLGRYYPHA